MSLLIQCIPLAQIKLVEYCEVSFQFSVWTETKMPTSWAIPKQSVQCAILDGPEHAILQGCTCTTVTTPCSLSREIVYIQALLMLNMNGKNWKQIDLLYISLAVM